MRSISAPSQRNTTAPAVFDSTSPAYATSTGTPPLATGLALDPRTTRAPGETRVAPAVELSVASCEPPFVRVQPASSRSPAARLVSSIHSPKTSATPAGSIMTSVMRRSPGVGAGAGGT